MDWRGRGGRVGGGRVGGLDLESRSFVSWSKKHDLLPTENQARDEQDQVLHPSLLPGL